MIKNEHVSLSCDVYSYAMLLWEIMTCQLPLHDVAHYMVAGEVVAGRVRNNKHLKIILVMVLYYYDVSYIQRPLIPDFCEPYLRKIMQVGWNGDPKVSQ